MGVSGLHSFDGTLFGRCSFTNSRHWAYRSTGRRHAEVTISDAAASRLLQSRQAHRQDLDADPPTTSGVTLSRADQFMRRDPMPLVVLRCSPATPPDRGGRCECFVLIQSKDESPFPGLPSHRGNGAAGFSTGQQPREAIQSLLSPRQRPRSHRTRSAFCFLVEGNQIECVPCIPKALSRLLFRISSSNTPPPRPALRRIRRKLEPRNSPGS